MQRLSDIYIFDLNLRILLGGSPQHYNKRKDIFAALSAYLSASVKLDDL